MPGNLKQSRIAVSVIFLLHGLVFSTWLCRIPNAQNRLQLSTGLLGLVLLATALGSLVAMPATGWFVAKHGSRSVAMMSSLGFCFALIPLAWADSAWALATALFFFGAAAGSQNVSMNAHAVSVELALERPIMGSFHALFSVGAVAGSALGGWLAGRGVSMQTHFVSCSVFFAFFTLLAALKLHQPERPTLIAGLAFRFPRQVVSLGLLAFCVLIVEGSMADWSAVYLETVLRTDAGRAALGYAAYSAAMVAGRFAGDRVAATVGRVALVRSGTILAACGLMVTVLAPTPPLAFTGFAIVGLGLSVITPNVFGAAGRVPGLPSGVGLAAVTTAGYLGFLTGPPLIGGLAQVVGLRLALGAMLVSLAVAIGLAGETGR
ncbi:MAG: MFS transporter [Bryobacteraceae bacterium]|nr:MFS transporter [Bryobacteraceae bacterium]